MSRNAVKHVTRHASHAQRRHGFRVRFFVLVDRAAFRSFSLAGVSQHNRFHFNRHMIMRSMDNHHRNIGVPRLLISSHRVSTSCTQGQLSHRIYQETNHDFVEKEQTTHDALLHRHHCISGCVARRVSEHASPMCIIPTNSRI